MSLTHLTFGYEFTSAVEQKQVAQQEAERARFIVEKVNFGFNKYYFLLLVDCQLHEVEFGEIPA